MAKYIKLKLLGLTERDVQLTTRKHVSTTTATNTTAVTINVTTSNTSSTTVTTVTAMLRV